MRSRTGALAAFVRAVARARAALLRAKDVAVHAEAHAAARVMPLESGLLEDPVQALLNCGDSDGLAARHDHGANATRNSLSADQRSRLPEVFDARIGATPDEDRIDRKVADGSARF